MSLVRIRPGEPSFVSEPIDGLNCRPGGDIFKISQCFKSGACQEQKSENGVRASRSGFPGKSQEAPDFAAVSRWRLRRATAISLSAAPRRPSDWPSCSRANRRRSGERNMPRHLTGDLIAGARLSKTDGSELRPGYRRFGLDRFRSDARQRAGRQTPGAGRFVRAVCG